MQGFVLYLFGAPHLERDGVAVPVERRKALALLTYLAVTGRPQTRDALAALLWPELDAQRARAALRATLGGLNQDVGKGLLSVQEDRIALAKGRGLEVDVQRFRELLGQVAAHGHPMSRLCDACLAALSEAADLFEEDFLAGFTLASSVEFDDWQAYQAEEFRRGLAGVLEKLTFAHAIRGEHGSAIGYARRRVGLDPLSEPAQRALMQAHAWSGDRAAALKQYEECVRVLEKELAVEPEPETLALQRATTKRTRRQRDPPRTASGGAAQPAHRPHRIHRPGTRVGEGRRAPGGPGLPAIDDPRPRRYRQDPAGDPGSTAARWTASSMGSTSWTWRQ